MRRASRTSTTTRRLSTRIQTCRVRSCRTFLSSRSSKAISAPRGSLSGTSRAMHTMAACSGRGLKGEITSGFSRHLERSTKVWEIARRLGYGLKLNTVVTSVNSDDDMSELVGFLKPHRWKIFKVLRIEGENDERVEPLLISQEQFEKYMARHRRYLQDFEGTQIVSEDNEDMLGTYAMIDPQGMVYTNLHSRYHYSKQSVGDIGFLAAWAQVMDGFSNIGFEKRGGKWNWSQGGVPLPLVKNSMGGVA